ncbi:MAG: nucleotidyltransferase family protein [Thermodesulfovibrionales bacterium]|nr:nucleotidyltransferase family protein [Thermodesulfovibrionales bacterium]
MNYNLSPEEKLLLSLSVLNPSADVLRGIGALLTDKIHPVDFDRIFECAAMNEVAPVIYENLRVFENIPGETIERFRNAYLYSVRNNVLNAEEMIRVLRFFEKGGVDAIPLKGSLASEIIFGNPGLYPATDIDILVKMEDLSKAEEILAEAGYGKLEGLSEEDMLSNHYHFVYRKDNYFLELHWNLVKRYFQSPPGFWWEEAGAVEYSGIRLNTLSPERYLLYAIFRLFDHGFSPLKFIIFISEFIRKYTNEIDWDKFLRFSRTYRMERVTVFTLTLLHELFGAPVHGDILSIHVRGHEYFSRRILEGIFVKTERPHLIMFLYTLLLDSPADFAKVTARRFFPGMGEIRLRYGLPSNSKKVYAYYLMNPILVFLKKR